MRQFTGIAGGWLPLLRKEIASSDLLPKAYEHYRPLLAEALCFFLERLSPVRLGRIMTQQMHLPPSVSTAERVVTLLAHSPALHKLGQVVARDRRLNPGFRRRLQQLESLTPQIPTAQVVRLLGREFKNWQKAGIKLGAHPLAEGSVAVIMPFVWRAPEGPRHGVFKLLKPGVRRMLEEDLEILSRLGQFLDQECAQLHLPALDYQDTFDTIKDLLVHEVRFDEEQRHLAEAAQIYRSMEGVSVPRLLPFCSSRLTAMERLFGQKMPGNGLRERRLREPVALSIIQALIATPIFSSKSAALFHADPHAGNFVISPNGRTGILDWSLVGHLQKRERIELVQLLLGAVTLDVRRMECAVERLSRRKPQQPALSEILQTCVNEVRCGTFPGVTWLTALLDKLVLGAGLRPDANLLLFRKSLLTLTGVVADLSRTNETARNALLDEAVVGAFIQHWMAEWPFRFYAAFDDRSFTTHLSTADVLGLMWLMWSAPASFARSWTNRIGEQGRLPSRQAVANHLQNNK
jgi:ubiquinone biosynthesis protein